MLSCTFFSIQQQPNVHEARKPPRSPTPPAGPNYPFKTPATPSPKPTYTVGRLPLQMMQPNKIPASEDAYNPDTAKKSMVVYEDVSPAGHDNENFIFEELNEYLFTPLPQE